MANTGLRNDEVVLFQGDSITDAGREADASGMGWGYAALVAAWHAAAHPELPVTFVNRGVSGDRVPDLKARWQADCLDLKPTRVSIMVGINDVWRRYDAGDPTDLATYEAGYRDLLVRTVATGAGIILLEPFVLPVPEDRRTWREDLDPKIAAVHRLAKEFSAILVPLDRLFATAATRRPPAFWAGDGVHPTLPGHALIARAWLDAVGAGT